MNPIFQLLIIQIVKLRKKRKGPAQNFEKELMNTQIEFTHLIRDSFFIVLGVLSASFGLNGFLLPNMFIDGGVMGISLIITELTGMPLSILIFAVNLPFIIMWISTINRQFAIKSLIAIILLAISVHFIPFPVVTDDKLLIAVFKSLF